MNEVVGTRTRWLHVLLVGAVAVCGVGVLLLVLATMLFGPDRYSRELAILAAVITLPLSIPGVVAAGEIISVARGRSVTRRRALIWAALVAGGGALLAYSSGLARALVLLVLDPARVGFSWPTIVVWSDGFDGASYLYLDQAGVWLPVAALALGLVSLVALAAEWRAGTEGRTLAG